jgi:hypothetical protein
VRDALRFVDEVARRLLASFKTSIADVVTAKYVAEHITA